MRQLNDRLAVPVAQESIEPPRCAPYEHSWSPQVCSGNHRKSIDGHSSLQCAWQQIIRQI